MQFNNGIPKRFRKRDFVLRILPAFFWFALIFAFDKHYIAVMTLCSAALHELSHLAVLLIFKKDSSVRSSVFGMRISVDEFLSYKQEIMVAIAGPLINVIIAFAIIIFANENEYLISFAILNLMTGISNLLPVKSFDGYRILSSTLHIFLGYERACRIIRVISFTLLTVLCFFSLFLISKLNTGYFLFCILLSYFLESIGGN